MRRWRQFLALLALLALLGTVWALAGCGTPERAAPSVPETPSTPERPQLRAREAALLQPADYFAQGPTPWQPAPLPDLAAIQPDFVVAADGSGSHRTVQAALDALPPAAPGARRHYVHVKAGSYREIICVRGKAPFTLYGSAADPGATRIVEGRWHAQPKPADQPANPCTPALGATVHGTPGSASVALWGDDIQLAHIAIVNDAMDGVKNGQGYPAGAGESGGAQAVALMTEGDRIQLHDVRLLGHQDTLYVRAPGPATTPGPARVHLTESLITGDVDFIFGNATLVIERSTIRSRAGRRAPGNGGHVLAPSTAAGVRLGFLVTHSRFEAEAGLRTGIHTLGRAWDHGVPRGQWQPGAPNGQALVRDSALGPHLGPWGASTARRPFSASGPQANRLAEFRNRPLQEPDHARSVLPAGDGWASAEGGTRGGADAQPGHVLEVRTRAELAAALALGEVPKIIQVRGRIDLAEDASDPRGRWLGEADWRDTGFDRAAFEAAYAPATWGRRPPEGALEQARQRSQKRQAAQVVLRVPSNTTLLGRGFDARIAGGMLLLDGVQQVIVRDLHFSDAFDHFPAWDPNDNAAGEWNAAYDTLSLRNARQVWITHNRFGDGARPDHMARSALGRPLQHHDGLLDITHGSDLVTVSWNHFRDHDKTSLVGGSDRHTGDAGKLRVSYHHNLWERTVSRMPRVRFGQVHVFNNLYVGAAQGPYAYEYAIGLGLQARVLSEHNVWQIERGVPVKRWNGELFADRGSIVNGRRAGLLADLRAANPGVALNDALGWEPQGINAPLQDAAGVAGRVRAGAGPRPM